MNLAEFTTTNLIYPALKNQDAAGVIQELSLALQKDGRITDVLPFYDAVLNREFLVSTEMESGLAFPHGRGAGVKELSFAFGRSSQPLLWQGAARSVRMVFLVAIPENDLMTYLSLLSGLARLGKEGVTELLLCAKTSEEIFKIFEGIQFKGQEPTRNGITPAKGPTPGGDRSKWRSLKI